MTASKSSGGAVLAAPSHGDHLVVAAEALIVRGKEQGYLTPDDVLAGFPEIEAEPDHLERIFQLFREYKAGNLAPLTESDLRRVEDAGNEDA